MSNWNVTHQPQIATDTLTLVKTLQSLLCTCTLYRPSSTATSKSRKSRAEAYEAGCSAGKQHPTLHPTLHDQYLKPPTSDNFIMVSRHRTDRRSYDGQRGLARGLHFILCQSPPPSRPTKQRRQKQQSLASNRHKGRVVADKVREITLGLMYCTPIPRDGDYDSSLGIISACSPRDRFCMSPRNRTRQSQFQFYQYHPFETTSDSFFHHRCHSERRSGVGDEEEETGIEVDENALRLEAAYNLERV